MSLVLNNRAQAYKIQGNSLVKTDTVFDVVKSFQLMTQFTVFIAFVLLLEGSDLCF